MAIVIRAAHSAADFVAFRALIDRMAAWDLAMTEQAGGGAQGVIAAFYSQDAEALQRAYGKPGSGLLLAFRDGNLLGCFGFGPFGEDVAEVQKLYVREEARGDGLGRRLMAEVLARTRQAGYRRCCLETASFMTDAIALYRTAGFAPCAPFRPITPGLEGISVFMDLDL